MPFVPRLARASLFMAGLIVMGGGRAMPRQAPSIAASHAPFSHNLSDYAVSELRDLDTTMKAVFHDDKAARKISKDADFVYKLKGDVHLRYKQEANFRADGIVRGFRASVTINDTRQTYRLAALDIKQTVDLSHAPGKRTSLFELGLISRHYLTYAQGEFQGERSLNGVPCVVFKVTFKDGRDTSHRTIWIDPRTGVTLKREEYLQEAQGGKLRDIWRFRDPKEVAPGIFFPTRMELDNSEGEKAGETEFVNTRVNVGLPDSVFRR
jgi:outer membrane lipoprotein-sorting protein